ncbi:hypothetical protein F4818DRAFT_398411 [Hypoxylon cercidicola]|nr:hypothetical protein F4818DRAFT_398411 [Hypoxylon cercidicola]
MFRCLVSMCIEMEYPGPVCSAEAHDPLRVNAIWDRRPSGFRHPDLSPEHVLVGKCDAESPDHKVCPILKLISLGPKSHDRKMHGTDQINGPKENLMYMALIMQSLIILDDKDGKDGYFETTDGTPRETLAGLLVPTPDDERTWKFRWLDPELRELVLHCAASYEGDRPDLHSVWLRVEQAIANQEASDTAGSDHQIRLFFRRLRYSV